MSHNGFFYLVNDLLTYLWYNNLPNDQAQDEVSIYTTTATVIYSFGIIFVGWVVDRYQWYRHAFVAAPILLTISYILMAVMPPAIPIVIFGIGEILSDLSLWTCLSQSNPPEKILIATALIYSLDNGLLGTIQNINTFIYQKSGSYFVVVIFYILLNIMGLIGALIFYMRLGPSEKNAKIEVKQSEERENYIM